jgi:hypothetical protein
MTQSDLVLKHLKSRKKLTSVEAIGLYGITRLAAVIFRIKEQGHEVVAKKCKGVRANYKEYSLAE